MDKLSFKKGEKPKGLASVANPYPSTYILSDKNWAGSIHPPSYSSKTNSWRVGIMVIKADIMEDKNPNCAWKWVHFAEEFETEALARVWIKEHWKSLNEKYNIRTDKD